MNPNNLYLTQTDTTVGFVSQDASKIAKAKDREITKPTLICVDSFYKLNQLVRVPKNHKKFIRKSTKTTFLYPNQKAIRVVKDGRHSKFLKRFDYLYSSSANRSTKTFDKSYAFDKVDIVIEDRVGFFEGSSSKIYKLKKIKKQKLR